MIIPNMVDKRVAILLCIWEQWNFSLETWQRKRRFLSWEVMPSSLVLKYFILEAACCYRMLIPIYLSVQKTADIVIKRITSRYTLCGQLSYITQHLARRQCPVYWTLSWTRWIQSVPTCLKIHFNIILVFLLKSPMLDFPSHISLKAVYVFVMSQFMLHSPPIFSHMMSSLW